jgi:hypothetical protein
MVAARLSSAITTLAGGVCIVTFPTSDEHMSKICLFSHHAAEFCQVLEGHGDPKPKAMMQWMAHGKLEKLYSAQLLLLPL